VTGVDVDYAVIRDWSVESGQFFDQNDVRSMRKVAVIGRTIAVNLYPDTDPVGQRFSFAMCRSRSSACSARGTDANGSIRTT